MKTKQVKVRATCVGIKERDRKAKGHGYNLCYLPYEKIEDVTEREIEQFKRMAKLWANDHIKQHKSLQIKLTAVEVDDGKDEQGNQVSMTSESYMMFSDKTINVE